MGDSFEEEEKYFYAFIYKVLHKGCPKINARFELNIELKREFVYIIKFLFNCIKLGILYQQ